MGHECGRQRCQPVQFQRRLCVLIPDSLIADPRDLRSRSASVGILAGLLVPGGWGSPAQPGSSARERALAAAFPNARIVADRVYLTEEQAEAAQELSGGDLLTWIYARYIAFRGGEVVGRAYVDTHIVRTKRESLLISLGADGLPSGRPLARPVHRTGAGCRTRTGPGDPRAYGSHSHDARGHSGRATGAGARQSAGSG